MLFWIRGIVRHRWLVIAMLLAVSALSVWSLRRAVIATSMQRMLLGDSPAYRSYQVRAEEFGGDELLIVSYADPDPLHPESIVRLENAVTRMGNIAELGTIRSLLDPIEVTNEDGLLRMDPYVDRVTERPERREVLGQTLEADATVRGLLRSDDQQHSALIVTLRPDPTRPSEAGPAVMHAVTDILEDEGFSDVKRAGFLATVAGVLEETSRNLTRLFPLAFVAVMGSVYVLFRRLVPVLVAMAVAGLAVLWTMGFAVSLDPEVNIFSAVVPAVILVVAISDTIHLWSAYLIELSDGYSKEEAIERSAAEVGRACLLTSMTTFLGFVSLSLIPTPIYRQVGVVLGVGVGLALLITITLMPAVMSFLPAPQPRTSASSSDWSERLAALTMKWSVPLVMGFGALTVLLVIGLGRIDLEADLMARMSASSTLRQENTFIRTHFSGSNLMEVFVDVPGEGLDAGVLQILAERQQWLQQQPLVDTAYSVVDLLERTHTALTDNTELPTEDATVAQLLLLLELGDAQALEALVNAERSSIRILTRLNTSEIRRSHDFAREVEANFREHLNGQAAVEATGLSTLFGGFIDDLVQGQRRGLLFSLLTIAVMMVLGLRSVRNGVVSMLPNLLPLMAVGGVAGLIWDKVDSDIALVAMMAIGIGVDDTIHFLMRLRLEARRAPIETAIVRTFRFAGRGIVYTTIILTLGFLPMALSDYFSIWLLGTFLPGALVVALLADLLLVPALATVGVFSFPPQMPESTDTPAA